MASLFAAQILAYPPDVPQNPNRVSSSPMNCLFQWPRNLDFDFSHYRLEFGYFPQHLDRSLQVNSNYFDFLLLPWFSEIIGSIHFRLSAVDSGNHSSPPTAIFQAQFQQPESHATFHLKHQLEQN